jgi:hypothetical protein
LLHAWELHANDQRFGDRLSANGKTAALLDEHGIGLRGIDGVDRTWALDSLVRTGPASW